MSQLSYEISLNCVRSVIKLLCLSVRAVSFIRKQHGDAQTPPVIEGGDEIKDEASIDRDWASVPQAAEILGLTRVGFVKQVERTGSG